MYSVEDSARRIGYVIGGLICLVVGARYYMHSLSKNQDAPMQINIETDNVLHEQQTIGISQLVKIGNGLYYDTTTNIVYWWNGSDISKNNSSMPTPYYLSNGQMCKYDSERNCITEIN